VRVSLGMVVPRHPGIEPGPAFVSSVSRKGGP
jgi:hypothetical protein